MSTGKRLAGWLLLSTALSFPALAHAQDATDDADITASDSANDADETYEEPDISIPGGAIVVTGRRNRDVVRSSTQVVSVLSSEEIARTGEGDIAGALSRVTGLSVVGAGRVYVRGLGDRYSLALLNGLPLPSPEPLSRVVPLDIFPTGIVASSLVQKTYSANFPGEFGGGVINLTTKAVPDESFLKLKVSGGGDTKTLGRDGLTYYGSDLDWTGFDNGNRDLPSNYVRWVESGQQLSDLPVRSDDPTELTQESIAAQIMPLNLATVTENGNLPPNFSASATAGTSFDVGSDAVFGVIANVGLKNSWRNRLVHSQTGNTDLDLVTDSQNFVTDNKMLLNAMLGLGLDFGEHRIRWTNLYIRDTLKTARLGMLNQVAGTTDGFDVATQRTAWFERQLMDSQLVAELDFDRLQVDLRGGYARTDREAPFNISVPYTRTNDDSVLGDYFVAYLAPRSGVATPTISFDDLKEELWYGGIDASYEVLDNLTATVGYAYTNTDRYSVSRVFSLRGSGDVLPVGYLQYVGLRRPGDLINGATLAGFAISLTEDSQFPAFDAGLEINAGYGKVQFLPFDTMTVELGVRYEDAKQFVALDESIFTNPPAGATPTNNAEDYFLPAATLTFEATDALQFRLSASKTIARPQFRELVEQRYFDADSNRTYRGNPFLTDSELMNAEARVEYYLGGGDRVSLAGFYKKIDNPIESYIQASAGGGQFTSFANAPEATLWGAEFDIQYGLDLMNLGGWFTSKQLLFVGNYTYTQSDISVGEGDLTSAPGFIDRPASDFFDDGDTLTGQSDHIANVQFSLEDQDRLEQMTLLLSYASKRVVSRSFQYPSDVYENPGLTVDFVARTEAEFMGYPVELEFEARNIFGRDNFEYVSSGDKRIEINTYKVGPSFSLGASIEF